MKPKRLKITEDCIGCVTCETLCPEVFVLGEEGLAYVKKDAKVEENMEGVKDSIKACPTEAIVWEPINPEPVKGAIIWEEGNS